MHAWALVSATPTILVVCHCLVNHARSVRFVPDLPKTSTGKVMRRELKTLDD